MKYKIILKQIDILEVDAPNEETAIKVVRDRLDPRSLAEIQVAEEATLDDNT